MSETLTWKRFELIIETDHDFVDNDTMVDEIAHELYCEFNKDFPQSVYWVTVGEIGNDRVNENIHLSFDVEINTTLDVELVKKAGVKLNNIINKNGLDVKIIKITGYEFDIKTTMQISNLVTL